MVRRRDSEVTLDRLRKIPGWSAAREPGCVWIRGDGDSAGLLAIAFTGLGARRVVMQREPGREARGSLLPHLDRWLDDVDLEVRERRYGASSLPLALEAVEAAVLVDTTGGSAEVLDAAASAGVPAYATSVQGECLRFVLADGGAVELLAPPATASIEASLVLAGLVSHDYAHRFVLQTPAELLPPRRFSFDVTHPWSSRGEPVTSAPARLSRRLRVLVVGAGGLGCPTGLALARRLAAGSRVVVCDYDHVDATNRNRQFLFSSTDAREGAPKVEALCRELRNLAPELDWVAVNGMFPNDTVRGRGPFDCVFTLTDTFRSRALVDHANVAPVLVNAAVDERSASAVLFHPGTVRMTAALGLAEAARRERGRAACRAAQPSIVSTNFIAGALAVSLLGRHVDSGPEPARVYEYELENPRRGGVWPPFLGPGG